MADGMKITKKEQLQQELDMLLRQNVELNKQLTERLDRDTQAFENMYSEIGEILKKIS